jgi:hypothetical protein
MVGSLSLSLVCVAGVLPDEPETLILSSNRR